MPQQPQLTGADMRRQASAQAGHDGGLQELRALPARPRPARAAPPARPLSALPPAAAGPHRDHRDSPGTYTRAELDSAPASVACARRLTRDTLARWDMQHLADDAQIIASELATNAITYAVPPRATLPAIIFAVHHRPGEIRFIVWDNGPGRPRHDAVGPEAETGRGLIIVDDLTGCNWGWWPTPRSGGKVVWAALSARAVRPTPDAAAPRLAAS